VNFPHARVAGRRPCDLPAYCGKCGKPAPRHEQHLAYKCDACRQVEKDKIRNAPPAGATEQPAEDAGRAAGDSGGAL
jgi:hypothetical protein